MKRKYKRSKHRCLCSSCELKDNGSACTEALLLKLKSKSTQQRTSPCLLPISAEIIDKLRMEKALEERYDNILHFPKVYAEPGGTREDRRVAGVFPD